MSRMPSAVLIVILSLALVATPLSAAPAVDHPTSLGVVLVAELAHARPDKVHSGTTIYDGDRLQTLSGGTLVARLGSGQMALSENSSVIVRTAPHGFSAELKSGSVVVSSGEGQIFQVQAGGVTIRSLNAESASGRITILSAKELILTGLRGTMEVSAGDEVKIMKAGTSYRVELEPVESEASPHASATPPEYSHFLEIVVPVGIIGTSLIIIRALESGDRP